MRSRSQIALSLVALAACVLTVGFSVASFTDTEENPQTISAVADWTAPTASSSVIDQTDAKGVAGYVRSGVTYYVYANVSDSGNPASGVSSVLADASSITSGAGEVPLVAGSYTADGVSYNYRSASLTAKGSLSAGTKTYALSLTDGAKNSDDQSFSAVAYGAFKGTGFETGNVSGGTEGKPEGGDTVSFEFNNLPDAGTIVSGWSGSGTKSVTVSITDGGKEDSLAVSGTGVAIGSVALKGDFTSSTATFSGSAMSLSGSTVTVILGSASGSIKTESAKSKAVWTPSSSNLDLAGNACSTVSVTGANKKQF